MPKFPTNKILLGVLGAYFMFQFWDLTKIEQFCGDINGQFRPCVGGPYAEYFYGIPYNPDMLEAGIILGGITALCGAVIFSAILLAVNKFANKNIPIMQWSFRALVLLYVFLTYVFSHSISY